MMLILAPGHQYRINEINDSITITEPRERRAFLRAHRLLEKMGLTASAIRPKN
jgi:hypothetical protein